MELGVALESARQLLLLLFRKMGRRERGLLLVVVVVVLDFLALEGFLVMSGRRAVLTKTTVTRSVVGRVKMISFAMLGNIFRSSTVTRSFRRWYPLTARVIGVGS